MKVRSDSAGYQQECLDRWESRGWQVSCDVLTIGQYLPPSLRHHKLVRYVPPKEFEQYENIGREMGFVSVISGSLVRSSFHAAETYLSAVQSLTTLL